MNYFKKFAAMLAALMLAIMFFACSDGDSKNNDDGKNDQDGNSVVCTYVQEGDQSNYFKFYSDGTVEYYIGDKLEYSRNTLYYKGSPAELKGEVKINVITGAELFSFTVVKNSDGSIIAKENIFGLGYTVKTESQGNNSGENGKNEKDDGKNDKDENSAVCTYVLEGDQSNYFIFYPDKTVEYYISDKLEYSRNTLTFSGSPTTEGTVTIKVISGAELFSFDVRKNDDGSLTAKEIIFGLVYTTKKDSSGENNSGSGDSGNSGGENGETQKDSLMFMGFDNVVNIENGTDITGITMTIYSLTSDTTLKFKGGINSITLSTIAAAMGTNDSVNIALDFSETTGITTWTNKLAGQKTLYAISLPSTVTSVEDNAFYECTNLKAITIPTSLSSSFSVNADYVNFTGTVVDWLNSSFELSSNQTLYINGTSLSGIVEIPESVTTIKNKAFYNCKTLESVVIPKSVTKIGESSFYRCSCLRSITLGNRVSAIGDSAFYGCTGLTSIIIPDNVSSIGEKAFYGCYNLTSVTIGNNVSTIEDSAFYNCSGLTSITIGNSVKTIGERAFYNCKNLLTITIPSNVTSINNYAFDLCTSLKDLIIEDSQDYLVMGYSYISQTYSSSLQKDGTYKTEVVNKTGSGLFHHCPLETVYLGRKLINSLTDCNSYHPFSNTTDTQFSVEIGTSVISIESSEFCECPGLTSIKIPNSVTSIGESAFYNCTGLTSISIPNSVTSIGDKAFYNCTSLKELIFEDADAELKLNGEFDTHNGWDYSGIFYNCPLEIIHLGRPLSHYEVSNAYGNYAPFYRKTTLTSVKITSNVTEIGYGMFCQCTGLTSIIIPDSVTEIGDSAFAGCSGLTSIRIPGSITSIKGDTFSGCTALKEVTIADGNGLLKISTGYSAGKWYSLFSDCPLETVYLGRNLYFDNFSNSAKASPFYNQYNLVSVTISNNVSIIWENLFYGCSGVTNITIPDSVKKIEDSAFAACNLTTVNYRGSESQWNAINIGNDAIPSTTTIVYNYTGD